MNVVLLHALARTRLSMARLGRHLERDGHRVIALDHRSTRATLPELATDVLGRLRAEGVPLDERTSFVGHSMGGLVFRALALVEPGLRVGPSVTLGTPHEGTRVAEALSRFAIARRIYGPAFATLDRARTELPPLPGPTLAIAGTTTSPFVPARWVLRALGETRPGDSTVLVDEALAEDAVAHLRIRAAHSFLPSHPEVRAAVSLFLASPLYFVEPRRTRPVVGLFVGGASRRMGSPKGRLPGLDGTPLLVRLAAVAETIGDVVLVGDASPYADLLPGVPRLADAATGVGPLGGLVTLSRHAGRRDAIALACDLPHVDEAAVRRLAEHRSLAPIVAMRAAPDAPFEPLFARYSPRARGSLECALADGVHGLQRVLGGAGAEALTPLDPGSLRDWDTPDDVAADGGTPPAPR